jgi:hypothetical protein
MQELFWFFLGGFVYTVLDKIISFYKKIQFINETKIHSFKLISFAYEQLVFITTAKYISLHQSQIDKEQIKTFKNADETTFQEWKKETAIGLKGALPPIYRKALEVENWDDIMNALDAHYKKVLHKKSNE